MTLTFPLTLVLPRDQKGQQVIGLLVMKTRQCLQWRLLARVRVGNGFTST